MAPPASNVKEHNRTTLAASQSFLGHCLPVLHTQRRFTRASPRPFTLARIPVGGTQALVRERVGLSSFGLVWAAEIVSQPFVSCTGFVSFHLCPSDDTRLDLEPLHMFR